MTQALQLFNYPQKEHLISIYQGYIILASRLFLLIILLLFLKYLLPFPYITFKENCILSQSQYFQFTQEAHIVD